MRLCTKLTQFSTFLHSFTHPSLYDRSPYWTPSERSRLYLCSLFYLYSIFSDSYIRFILELCLILDSVYAKKVSYHRESKLMPRYFCAPNRRSGPFGTEARLCQSAKCRPIDRRSVINTANALPNAGQCVAARPNGSGGSAVQRGDRRI